eukprot:TRINITY_DN39433_c1_g1_i1.p1 TRINITY_DN39433_c1_g1~~TRINITY_DN39433_c1_g1_i1.p1  ORF type:complete len:175 (+),score=8.02 TRINITY_DN39433_c1_g1_i1:187-711(+)
MAYCGCSTRCNKANWSLFAIFLVLGLVGAGLTIYYGDQCVAKEYRPCIEAAAKADPQNADKILDQLKNWKRWFNGKESGIPSVKACDDQLKQCAFPQLPICLIGAIVFLFLTPIPLFVMCCCAPKPKNNTKNSDVYANAFVTNKVDGYKEPLINQHEVQSFPIAVNEMDSQAKV